MNIFRNIYAHINLILNKMRKSKYFNLFALFVIILTAFLQYFSIELSYLYLGQFFNLNILHKLAGIITILFFDFILVILFKNLRLSLNCGIFLSTILAFANHYVNLWHGSPFTFAELKNIRTALSVASTYKISFDIQIIAIIMLVLLQLFIVNILFNKNILNREFSAPAFALVSVCIFFCYFHVSPVIPKNAVSWKWYNSIVEYGYTPCLVQFSFQSINAIPEPDGYNESELKQFVSEYSVDKNSNDTPDIIYVLNETFYDLKQITDINTDTDYLNYFYNLENSISGYAVCANAGGGTNCSEFELLTSNSLKLAPSITPFNTVELENIYSVVGHLNNLGYTSIATHPDHEINYRRNIGYPALGFDESYFYQDFTNTEHYAGRGYPTDKSVYENSINWYENMPEGPRFMYILTIQNHGGYTYLDPEDYLVHTTNDYGEYTDDINEYSTCVKLSDEGFKTLIEYYKNSDRDVIICMVGDHAPAFSPFIVDKEMSENEKEIALRSVPYIIWSNYKDLSDYSISASKISMVYLTPTILDIADVKTTPYYDYMLKLRDQVPVITSFGIYQDYTGKIYNYDEVSEHSNMLNRYFDLEYAVIKQKDYIGSFAK